MDSITQQAAASLEKSTLVQLIPVLVGGNTVILVEHNGQPYVVMRPLVMAMGLDWPSQYTKLMQKFGAVVVEITTTGADGKQYSMICLPLRKLPGWFYSLNLGKLAPTLRPKVEWYQNTCDEVLWQFWTGTYLPQHSAENATLSRLHMSYERERTRISLLLADCAEAGLANSLYDTYVRLSNQLGALIVPLVQLAPGVQQKRLEFEGGAV